MRTPCPTAIGAFSWTFGSYAEFAEANRHNNVCLAVCRGDHPLMYTVKKFYVPNEFLFTKYLATYPSINENNIIAWCVFLSRHFDRLTVFDYNSAWWTCWHQMRAFYQNKLLEHPVIAPQNRIHFTLEEEREGERLAYELGITRNYVCFFSRDSSYTDTVHDRSHLPPAPSNAGNEYRNSDINRYKYMAEKLEYRGIQSVRMGAIVNKPYEGKGVDYSTLGRSEFMDIYLFSKCLFFINDASGIEYIPRYLFNKPIIDIFMPSGILMKNEAFVKPTLMLFYKCKNEKNNHYLTLREFLELSSVNIVGCSGAMEYMKQHGIIMEVIDEEDIWEIAEEMLNIIEGTQRYTEEDYALREKFRSIVWEYLSQDNAYAGTYGRPGAAWLRKNKWFLE